MSPVHFVFSAMRSGELHFSETRPGGAVDAVGRWKRLARVHRRKRTESILTNWTGLLFCDARGMARLLERVPSFSADHSVTVLFIH
jgi:hypothetical protein